MKKKLVLSLLVVALLVTLAAVALAIEPPSPYFPYLYETNASDCWWTTVPEGRGVLLRHFHAGECEVYCRHCGWGTPPVTTETVMVSTTTAVAKTATGQRLIVHDTADFSGKVLGYLDFGAKVEVLSVEGGFAKVTGNCGGKTVTGYVWSKDLHDAETVTYSYEVEVPQPQPEPV